MFPITLADDVYALVINITFSLLKQTYIIR